MYSNSGGEAIQNKIVSQLHERGIKTITDLNLASATAHDGVITCNNVIMEELDAFFSYNAGQQTPYQVYLYQVLNESVPCLNNFDAFALSEDKLKTAHKLARAGVRTTDYMLCNRANKQSVSGVVGWCTSLLTDGVVWALSKSRMSVL